MNPWPREHLLLDAETRDLLKQRTSVVLPCLFALGGAAMATDLFLGPGPRAGLLGVQVVYLAVVAVLGVAFLRASSERWIVVLAVSAVCASIGGSLLASLHRHEIHSTVMSACALTVAMAAFLPWGWKMQLVPMATAAAALAAEEWMAGLPPAPSEARVLTAICLVLSLYFAHYHGRVRGVLARHGDRIAESRRRIERLNRELEQRVAARESILGKANLRLENFCRSLAAELHPSLASTRLRLHALQEALEAELDRDSLALLDRVQAATRRMEETLVELLDYVALGRRPLHPVIVDLSATAEARIRELRELEPARRVEVAITPGITAAGDEALLGEAVGQLIDNAWKFSAPRDPGRIEVGVRQALAGTREFFVRDNGVGFDMEHAAKLFRPFTRLEAVEAFPGHGMGLARAARIIDRHGERLRARATPGEGSEFSFRLR